MIECKCGRVFTSRMHLNNHLRESDSWHKAAPKKRPGRKKLLHIVAHCQNLFSAISAAANDRNPNRAADIEAFTQQGFNLCVNTLQYDPPQNPSPLPDPRTI